jgi:hypothetical protein
MGLLKNKHDPVPNEYIIHIFDSCAEGGPTSAAIVNDHQLRPSPLVVLRVHEPLNINETV